MVLEESALETAKHTARFLVQDGEQSRTVPIDKFPFTIGRQADRDLSLLNPQVSRQHAVIEREGDGFVIRDLGSRHGTLVNGVKVEMARLSLGIGSNPGLRTWFWCLSSRRTTLRHASC